jgi:hypothetical protein
MADDKRSQDRREEDELTAGPTPEVRRAEGHGDEGEEITKGPTPEVREAERGAGGGSG